MTRTAAASAGDTQCRPRLIAFRCRRSIYVVVTWLAHQQQLDHRLLVRQAAWYVKEQPTFSDALAWVRRDLWNHALFFQDGKLALRQARLEPLPDPEPASA